MNIEVVLTGDPAPVVTWQKDGTPVAYDDRIRQLPDGTLSIRNFAASDVARYTVVVQNNKGQDEASIDVQLPVAPTIADGPTDAPTPAPDGDAVGYAGQDVSVYLGRTLQLDADVQGIPDPSVVWRLPSGERISTGTSSGRFTVLPSNSLVVRDVQPRDAGRYRIIATNPAGIARKRSRVTVLGMSMTKVTIGEFITFCFLQRNRLSIVKFPIRLVLTGRRLCRRLAASFALHKVPRSSSTDSSSERLN